ncbi:heterokaryon incompatibility protein-domain-containing protein [Penicillium pulvis]|uniref:heterokaryon incompatibility protein-domain-containing protein n=1 Tax=Penicillium pulvis TaxID=1562058 RepID=UPI00254870A2|nr:heterokaryon incompatibility protein-domain-containing protein [Penicillium pulvis]KAJ5806482.1 heterokaryon incompatibility protein-domain-containing protein [Penicillium pulvis]
MVFDKQSQYIEPLIDILNCEVETATGDPFGSVTGGFLKLSGLLATIQIESEPDGSWHVLFGGIWSHDKELLWIRFDGTPSTYKLHCLPLYLDVHQPPEWSMSCLLLEPTGKKQGQFKRAGTLHAISGAMGMHAWTNLEDNKNENWLEYESRCDGGGYVIIIV